MKEVTQEKEETVNAGVRGVDLLHRCLLFPLPNRLRKKERLRKESTDIDNRETLGETERAREVEG